MEGQGKLCKFVFVFNWPLLHLLCCKSLLCDFCMISIDTFEPEAFNYFIQLHIVRYHCS